jgi:hypothetical protein
MPRGRGRRGLGSGLQLGQPGIGRQQRQPNRLGPGRGQHLGLIFAPPPVQQGVDEGS